MDLQIRVFKNSLDDKPVFRSTIVDVSDASVYMNLHGLSFDDYRIDSTELFSYPRNLSFNELLNNV